MIARSLFATVLVAAASAHADVAATSAPPSPAPSPAAAPAPADTGAAAAEAPAEQTGFAIGAELGEPTSLTAGWFTGKLALLAAVGTGTYMGPGLSIHADAQMLVTRLAPAVPLRVGLGGRFYHHGYEAMSYDEIPHEHYGLRASAAVALERGALQLYAEVAPGIDIKRTPSCTLLSGPNSICPHAQTGPLFVQLVAGARWFISR